MGRMIDRTGEIGYNNFGSKMVIVKYRKRKDIDVYFEEYDWTAENVNYGNFKKGKIACPYEPRVYRVGYIGEGKYRMVDENGKHSKCYEVWVKMLQRCFDEKYQIKRPTYKGCEVCAGWLNFQVFAKWFYNNYYEIEGERIHLDKDILIKGNNIYSPETCVFVPQRINSLFVKRNKVRGEYPIGVSYHKMSKKFVVHCNAYDNKKINLGYYSTSKEAFNVYKEFKEQYIKEVADEYKDKIPTKLYDAMYNYKVEITD